MARRPLSIALPVAGPGRVLVAGVILFAAFTLPPYWNWLSETMWGVVVIYLWTKPTGKALVANLVLAALLFGVYAALEPGGWPGLQSETVLRSGFFLGWASLLCLGFSGPSPAFFGAAMLPVLVVVRWIGLHAFQLYSGPTADGQMFLLDHGLGDPAYRLGQWLNPHPWLRAVLWFFYMGVPLTLALAYGAAASDSTSRRRLLWSWAIAGALSAPLYKLYPVAGPGFAFDRWPYVPVGVTGDPLEIPAGIERTSMPSLHLTWVILAWHFAPRSPRWVRAVLALFVATTVLATLGLGEHYLVDLLAALPYTAAVAVLVVRLIRPPSSPDPTLASIEPIPATHPHAAGLARATSGTTIVGPTT